MKKIFSCIMIVLILLMLAVCGYGVWSWISLDDTSQPSAQVTIGSHPVMANRVELTIPICWGILERDFVWENVPSDSILIDTFKLEMSLPQEYDNSISVKKSSNEIFSGDFDSYQDFQFTENGEYTIGISLAKSVEGSNWDEKQNFSIPVIIDVPPPPPPEPTLTVSSSSVIQGDTLTIEVQNLPKDEAPNAKTDLNMTDFMQVSDGHYIAYVGVADAHEPGQYEVEIEFNNFKQVVPITVTQGTFNRQDLWIDVTQPSISEANSPAAYQQYRDTIPHFYETSDPTLYWSGKFLQPVEGRLSSEYGLLRYTNGGATPRRHAGIDLAVGTGASIQAPADGRVVYSDYLLNTGNTLVIEHGGGLKSYYFHLNERDVSVDDLVKAGQLIGKVGTTGYSTGPHLHFEIRIGNQNLDPFKFFDGTGGCFTTSVNE